jgi:hypothetical protein
VKFLNKNHRPVEIVFGQYSEHYADLDNVVFLNTVIKGNKQKLKSGEAISQAINALNPFLKTILKLLTLTKYTITEEDLESFKMTNRKFKTWISQAANMHLSWTLQYLPTATKIIINEETANNVSAMLKEFEEKEERKENKSSQITLTKIWGTNKKNFQNLVHCNSSYTTTLEKLRQTPDIEIATKAIGLSTICSPSILSIENIMEMLLVKHDDLNDVNVTFKDVCSMITMLSSFFEKWGNHHLDKLTKGVEKKKGIFKTSKGKKKEVDTSMASRVLLSNTLSLMYHCVSTIALNFYIQDLFEKKDQFVQMLVMVNSICEFLPTETEDDDMTGSKPITKNIKNEVMKELSKYKKSKKTERLFLPSTLYVKIEKITKVFFQNLIENLVTEKDTDSAKLVNHFTMSVNKAKQTVSTRNSDAINQAIKKVLWNCHQTIQEFVESNSEGEIFIIVKDKNNQMKHPKDWMDLNCLIDHMIKTKGENTKMSNKTLVHKTPFSNDYGDLMLLILNLLYNDEEGRGAEDSGEETGDGSTTLTSEEEETTEDDEESSDEEEVKDRCSLSAEDYIKKVSTNINLMKTSFDKLKDDFKYFGQEYSKAYEAEVRAMIDDSVHGYPLFQNLAEFFENRRNKEDLELMSIQKTLCKKCKQMQYAYFVSSIYWHCLSIKSCITYLFKERITLDWISEFDDSKRSKVVSEILFVIQGLIWTGIDDHVAINCKDEFFPHIPGSKKHRNCTQEARISNMIDNALIYLRPFKLQCVPIPNPKPTKRKGCVTFDDIEVNENVIPKRFQVNEDNEYVETLITRLYQFEVIHTNVGARQRGRIITFLLGAYIRAKFLYSEGCMSYVKSKKRLPLIERIMSPKILQDMFDCFNVLEESNADIKDDDIMRLKKFTLIILDKMNITDNFCDIKNKAQEYNPVFNLLKFKKDVPHQRIQVHNFVEKLMTQNELNDKQMKIRKLLLECMNEETLTKKQKKDTNIKTKDERRLNVPQEEKISADLKGKEDDENVFDSFNDASSTSASSASDSLPKTQKPTLHDITIEGIKECYSNKGKNLYCCYIMYSILNFLCNLTDLQYVPE